MFPRHVNSIHTQNCPTKSHASSDFRIMERIKEGKKEIGSSHKGFLKRTITREGREGHVDMNGKFLTPLHIHWHLSSHHAACQDNLRWPWSKPKLMLCSTTRNWCRKSAQISTLEKLWKAKRNITNKCNKPLYTPSTRVGKLHANSLYIFYRFCKLMDDIKMRCRKRISTDETKQFANIISWKQTSG